MAENKIIGYKRIFGFVLPDWVSESMIRNVMAGLLSSAVMLLVLIFVIWPNLNTVATRSSQLSVDKANLETLKSSSQGLERLKTDLTVSDQDRILAAMPTVYSPDGAIYLLRRISQDAGVSIISYTLPSGVLVDSSPSTTSLPGSDMVTFAAYPIRITVSAPVEALLSFISKIESSLPFGVVSDLNLQEVVKLSRSAADKAVQLAMEIKFYQAVLKTVNISKLKPLTPENLILAKELAGYNYLVVPEDSGSESSTTIISPASNMFGL